MSTATTAKPKARRRPATPNKKLPGAAWMDCAKGKVFLRPGVDLTKPTLPPGKYFA